MSAPEERSQRLMVYALGFGCFFLNNVLTPVLSRYAVEMGVSLTAVGFVLSSSSIVPALFAAQIGHIGARIGLRRMIAGSSLLMALAGTLYLVKGGYWTLVLAQMLIGTLYLGAWINSQTYSTRLGDRDRVVGMFATFTALGQAAGPIVGGAAFDLGGYTASFVVFIVACLILALLTLKLPELAVPAGEARSGGSTLAIVRRPGIQTSFLFSFICLFAITTRTSFVPVYLKHLGFSGSLTGLILASASVGQAAFRPFTKDLMRRLGLSTTLVVAALVGIVCLALVPFASVGMVLVVLSFLHGNGAGLQQSLGLILVAEHTATAERGLAVGLRATVNQVASATAPFFIGAVAQAAGLRSAFVACAVLLASIGVWMMVTARRTQAQSFQVEVAVGRES